MLPAFSDLLSILRVASLAGAGLTYWQIQLFPSLQGGWEAWVFVIGAGVHLIAYGLAAHPEFPARVQVLGGLVASVINGAGAAMIAWILAHLPDGAFLHCEIFISSALCALYALLFIPVYQGPPKR